MSMGTTQLSETITSLAMFPADNLYQKIISVLESASVLQKRFINSKCRCFFSHVVWKRIVNMCLQVSLMSCQNLMYLLEVLVLLYAETVLNQNIQSC